MLMLNMNKSWGRCEDWWEQQTNAKFLFDRRDCQTHWSLVRAAKTFTFLITHIGDKLALGAEGVMYLDKEKSIQSNRDQRGVLTTFGRGPTRINRSRFRYHS
jgi:hypothetical protein